MKKICLIGVLMLLMGVGCGARSISNSGYRGGYYGYHRDSSLYRGELTVFDVIGVDAGREYSDKDIADALDAKKPGLSLRKGHSVMLVQSGAMIPDEKMVENMEKFYTVSVFSGVPEKAKNSNLSYSQGLRYAAAKGGMEKIVAYWGILECGRRDLGTKTVSWVPVIGRAIPDEKQEMRIRLKVAVIDVRTGQWDMFTPRVFDGSASSTRTNRESSDQKQVALLKAKAYEEAVSAILARFGR